jgi:hypothetical protein
MGTQFRNEATFDGATFHGRVAFFANKFRRRPSFAGSAVAAGDFYRQWPPGFTVKNAGSETLALTTARPAAGYESQSARTGGRPSWARSSSSHAGSPA